MFRYVANMVHFLKVSVKINEYQNFYRCSSQFNDLWPYFQFCKESWKITQPLTLNDKKWTTQQTQTGHLTFGFLRFRIGILFHFRTSFQNFFYCNAIFLFLFFKFICRTFCFRSENIFDLRIWIIFTKENITHFI
jgi:hypothetical protein